MRRHSGKRYSESIRNCAGSRRGHGISDYTEFYRRLADMRDRPWRTTKLRLITTNGSENPRPGDLGRNQERRNHGRHADKSENLIYRKHDCRPPKAGCGKVISIHPRRRLLIAGQNLVCECVPRDREQRQNRNNDQCFHGAMVVLDCGQKRQSLAHFQDQPEKLSWRRSPEPCPPSPLETTAARLQTRRSAPAGRGTRAIAARNSRTSAGCAARAAA